LVLCFLSFIGLGITNSVPKLLQVKKPGLDMSTIQSELDLSYGQRYQDVQIPEAYERLILDT
jgi:glucose-6-phosphate 1-dehydrogenase